MTGDPRRETAAQAIRDAAHHCYDDPGASIDACLCPDPIFTTATSHAVISAVEGSPEALADAVLAAIDSLCQGCGQAGCDATCLTGDLDVTTLPDGRTIINGQVHAPPEHLPADRVPDELLGALDALASGGHPDWHDIKAIAAATAAHLRRLTPPGGSDASTLLAFDAGINDARLQAMALRNQYDDLVARNALQRLIDQLGTGAPAVRDVPVDGEAGL